ncbi:response regulator [Massilia sp. W12]|uniref:response regulator n=1 Tax=Massilia sp. W12 TaxID=3126507 RepID=UPI0030CE80A5
MELFASDEHIAGLRLTLSNAQGLPRWRCMTELAWHLRERDTRGALAMADDILRELAQAPASAQIDQLKARTLLTRGETLRLFAELAPAQQEAQSAGALFLQHADVLGQSDACNLQAWIAMEQGDTSARDYWLEQAAALALQGDDRLRADVSILTQARAAVFRDAHAALAQWSGQYQHLDTASQPALAACLHDFLGTAASQQSEFARAISEWTQAYEAALASAQLRRAAVIATNIGNSFNSLNEHNTALEWMQRGLDLSRPRQWPATLGGTLMQTGETLRRLSRYEAAHEILLEAMQNLDKLPNSRNYGIALEYMGDLMLDKGDYPTALDMFTRQQQHANLLAQSDFLISAARGRAHALSHMDQAGEALEAAHEALRLCQQFDDPFSQIQVLRVLAEIHQLHSLPAPEGMHAPNPVLHYLLQSIEVAQGISGYTVPGELYDALGREYARIGHFALAYSMSLQASMAREKTHNEGATNRAIAMQVRHQTERAQADGEHHRQLAAEQARRAEILAQTSATLEHLSSIGQEITAHLDADAVFQTLNRHLHGLLEADSLSVFMLEPDGQHMKLVFGNENGKPLPHVLVSVQNPQANSARCLRERREILIEQDPAQSDNSNHLQGTTRQLSMLYGPLAVGEHVLGVMSVQSARVHAFGERERLIFRSLCAYGAIAFDNSATYRQLKATLQTLSETQEQLASAARLQTSLIEQKMAAEQLARQRAEEATQMKSAFLANMSHEIRTPMNAVIGLAHLALKSGLNAKQHDYLSKIHRAGLSLLGLINDILDFSKIEAGKLDIEQAPFSLDEVLSNVASVSSQKAAEKGLEYLFRVPHEVPRQLVGDALRLGQVLINLVNNAIKFTEQGEIELSCRLLEQDEEHALLQFAVRDTGIGMTPQQVANLFQPFTQADGSTSRKFGGTGLGLSISQHLVQLMAHDESAKIKVQSASEAGSCFSFTLRFTLGPALPATQQLPARLRDARVLVVDDNPIALEIFVEALRALPLRVHALQDARLVLDALLQAQQENDPYQLLISDWQMPCCDGITLAQAVRAESRLQSRPEFILATAFGREEVQEQAEQAGIAGFLYKPVSEALLYATLNSVFAPHERMVVQSNTPQHQFAPQTVLLAEDNEINQQITRELLQAVGLQADLAQNGREVLDKLAQHPPGHYPLLLMDLEMPEMDGHATTAAIRADARYAALPLVALTAHALPEIRERCLSDGMQDYLTKPIQPELLYACLARFLPLAGAPAAAPQAPEYAPPAVALPPQSGRSSSLAARAALEQLSALMHLNPQDTLEYFASIESGLALLLEQNLLEQLHALLYAGDCDAACALVDQVLLAWEET